jgi:WD40 repeat protein
LGGSTAKQLSFRLALKYPQNSNMEKIMVNRFRLLLIIFVMVLLAILSFAVVAQENTDGETISIENASSVVEIQALEGHEGAINSITFSPDGTLITSGGEDTMVHLWDTATAREVVSLAGHTQSITAVQFNPDGTLLASTGKDYNAFIWNVATHENTQNVGFTEESASFVTAFFPEATFHTLFWLDDSVITLGDGGLSNISGNYNVNNPSFFAAARASTGLIALGSNQGIRLVRDNVGTTFEGTVIEDFTSIALSLAFAADATQLAVGDRDDTIQVWDISDIENIVKTVTLTGHTDDITGVAFNPDGNLLVSSSLDGTVRLWNLDTETEIAVLSGPNGTEFRSLTFSPNGSLIATAGSDGVVRLWGVGNDLTVVEEIIPQEGEWETESISFRQDTNVRLSFTVELDAGGNWEMVSNIISIQNTGNGVIAGTLTFWDEALESDGSFSGELRLEGRQITISGQFVSPTEAQGTININDGLPAVEWTASP